MRVAIAGATGRIGTLTATALQSRGHDVVGISRALGVDLSTGEGLVASGPLPWTVVPATQFHDFAATVAGWTEHDGSASVPPLLVQPIAPRDVAEVLAEVAVGPARGRHPDIAGPERQDLVDMARRTLEARGHAVELVPTWSTMFSPAMAGDVLLPDDGARIMPTTFDAWLAANDR